MNTPSAVLYVPSLHDALPILDAVVGLAAESSGQVDQGLGDAARDVGEHQITDHLAGAAQAPGELVQQRQCRSEEHTSELQSPCKLVCRLLPGKKKDAKLGQSS